MQRAHDPGVVREKLGDRRRPGVVRTHAHGEGAQAPREQVRHVGGDDLAGVLAPRADWRDQRGGAHHRPGGQVTVATEVLGRAVDDQIRAVARGCWLTGLANVLSTTTSAPAAWAARATAAMSMTSSIGLVGVSK